MLADKLLGQLISATERQNRKVDVTNRLLGLMAKVKPGNLNTATSVPVASTSPKQGSMNGIGSSDNNDNFIKLIEYSKITSENSVKTSDLTEKMLKVIESKFGLFNSNLIDIKEAIEEEDPPEKEDKPKEKFNFFKEVEQDLKADYGRVKENILDFVVPGRARKKKEQEELSKKEKDSKEPKRPKVVPLVATPIQTAVANVDQQSRSFDTSPIVKAMDRNTLRLIDKLDELKSAQGEGGGSILGDLGGALGGAALLSKAGGAIKGGAAALGRGASAGASAVGRAVLPRVAAGAATLAGGAALPLALGAAAVGGVAYLESTAGKDEQGNDLKVDEKQDEANWQKMTVGQKVQSGLARGIEKIGSTLFLGNMARQARVERIKKETDYLQNNAKEVTASNEASTPSQKAEDIAPKEKVDIQFSEATFAQKDPENYKKFVEYRNKRSEEIYNKRAEKFTSSTSEQRKETTKQISQDLAKRDAVLKFKGEIEAAGAGSVKVTNQEKQITTETNTNTSETNSSKSSVTNSSKSSETKVNPSTPASVSVSPSSVESVPAPTQAGMIKELTTANEETSKMSAPPIIVNNVNNQAAPSQGSNSVQSLPSVPTSRNTNSTIERVMTKNAFFTLA